MKIDIQKTNYSVTTDAIIIPCFVDDADTLTQIDKKLNGNLRDELISTQFDGEFGKALWLSGSGEIKARKVGLVGIGEKEEYSAEVGRRWAGTIYKAVKDLGVSNISLVTPADNKDTLRALAEGLWLAEYRFTKYKKEEKKTGLAKASILVSEQIDNSIMQNAAIDVLGTILARDLVNEPSNFMRPRDMVEKAIEIADSAQKISLQVLTRKELEEGGFGALLAVANGSSEQPYMLHLKYSAKNAKKRIALVGKGVTFDSGGISLKPADKMEDMKIDMAGAAAVLGVFKALTLTDLPVEIHGIVPLCENLPSGKAVKPGDIITSYSGKTIEVLNTDAEGRLILADALSYTAKEVMPNTIIDFATLTGACMVALGENIAGVMTQNEQLADELTLASRQSGELVWRLPLVNDYKKKMDSKIADIKNITADRYAGAIMGGMFLQEFVPEQIAYAHIDIAGPAHATNNEISYIPEGGTGFGVRLVLDYLRNIAK